MAQDHRHQPYRLRQSKRRRHAPSPAAPMSSPQCQFAPCSLEGGDHHLGEREGEVFSDLTRRAISISSSEGLPSTGGEVGAVVDLTNDSGVEDAVDLTSPVRGSYEVLGERRVGLRERGRRRRRRGRTGDVVVLDASDESTDDEVQIMEPTQSPPTSLPPSNSTPPTLTDTASLPSPTGGGVVIKCPICMESAATFKQRGSQVAVTTCGHVFCDLCIRRAIAEQRRCPTCRKKLTVRQIHPLYLPL